jgi:hypothetical protein
MGENDAFARPGSSVRGVPRSATMTELKIGPHAVRPPVVLAPMAGITNAAFRTLCREQGGGLFVSEMITTRALVERNREALGRLDPDLPWPEDADGPRGKSGVRDRVHLPDGWLDDPDDGTVPVEAELDSSGG